MIFLLIVILLFDVMLGIMLFIVSVALSRMDGKIDDLKSMLFYYPTKSALKSTPAVGEKYEPEQQLLDLNNVDMQN
jgi:hypothetical protein